MHLLVDIGNSRLKWAVSLDNQFYPGGAAFHAGLEKNLPALWACLPAIASVNIACVGSKAALATVRAAARSLWPQAVVNEARTQAEAFGVRNGYDQPSFLGVDRWLALIAVRRLYPGRVTVVDCGTAITVDLIDERGHHEGGYISPGLDLMRRALASGTEALPLGRKNYPPDFGRSTQAGIYNGTLASAAGMITYIVNRQTRAGAIVMTGGDAAAVADRLNLPVVVDADLVLKGLAATLR